MVVSGTPTALAVVAAPMRKLWLVNIEPSNPAAVKACCILVVKGRLWRGDLSSSWNKGPALLPQRER